MKDIAFRVGLLFHASPAEPSAQAALAGVLARMDAETTRVRDGHPLTVVAFLRTMEAAQLTQAVAQNGYPVEAATFGDAGVAFAPLDVSRPVPHAPLEGQPEFEFGMQVLLARCHAMVIACRAPGEFAAIKRRLSTRQSACARIALVALDGGAPEFLEPDSDPPEVDAKDWYLGVADQWKSARPGIGSLPALRTTFLGRLFPWLYSLILLRRFETIKKRPQEPTERCLEGMGLFSRTLKKLDPADEAELKARVGLLCPFFDRHDRLGSHYSNVFRTTCLLVPSAIALATVLAVAAAVDPARHRLWHWSEAFLLAGAAGLYLRSKFKKHLAHWVDNRLVTEFMRSAALHAFLHTAPDLTIPPDKPDLWTRESRVFWTYFRSLPPLAFQTAPADLLSARRTAVAEYAEHQMQFHEDFARQHWAADRWLTRISGRAFLATVCFCIAQLVLAWLHSHAPLPAAFEQLPTALMMLTLACACGAFVLTVLNHQLGFEAIAERSTIAAGQYRTLLETMRRGPHPASPEQVYDWARESGVIILDEQHSWYRHIPSLRMHL
ncbi:MAG: hypothetical protein LAP87_22010 [Acidobacteriia bacterium]|nr:hypothetical protein [Terriglobia bacterium]